MERVNELVKERIAPRAASYASPSSPCRWKICTVSMAKAGYFANLDKKRGGLGLREYGDDPLSFS